MKIGIFDSGIGGLSVLHLALKKFSDVQFIYYADRKNVPYGEKSTEEVVGFVDEVIRFFIKNQANAVVIACNTATSAAVYEMRKRYVLPIIGMEPAIKKALDLYGEKKVLAAATPITVMGSKMNQLLQRVDKNHIVDLVALPKLVHFAEKGEFDSDEVRSYLKNELEAFSLQEYASFVLGCTHFNYFKDSFRALLPANIRLIDGNEGTLSHLASSVFLKQKAHGNRSEVSYFFSGEEPAKDSDLEQISRYMKRLDAMFSIS